MATESKVTTAGSHPFSTGDDLCLVHNGSLSNHNRLRENLSWANEAALETLARMTQRYAPLGGDAETAALRRLTELVRREALVMGFADVFLVLTALIGGLMLLLLLMRRPLPPSRRT